MILLKMFSNISKRIPASYSSCHGYSVDALKSEKVLIPSRTFVEQISRRGLQEQLSRVIAEIDVLKELSHEVPLTLSDSQWNTLLHLRGIEDRESFVRTIYFEELSKTKIEQCNEVMNYEKGQFLREKQRRFDEGEIVYGRTFYDYIDLRGREFRKWVDNMYGSRLLIQERSEEKMPQLIFDCRFLQKNSDRDICGYIKQVKTVYDYNWFNPDPFRVSIASLFMDDYVARTVKQNWRFALGRQPDSMDTELPKFDLTEFEDLEDVFPTVDEGENKRHVFAPRITSRSIRNVLDPGVTSDQVAFISNNAPRYLEDDLSKYKAFVICTTKDHTNLPMISTNVAAADDGFKTYKLPLEKYVTWERGCQELSYGRTVNILKDVYLKKHSWADAFYEHIPNWHFVKGKDLTKEKAQIIETRKAREDRLKLLKEAVKELHYRKVQVKPNPKNQDKGPRIHKYSREERNRRRMQLN